MNEDIAKSQRFGRIFLLTLAILISMGFLWMIRNLWIALLMSALLAGLSTPLYKRLLRVFKGKRSLSAGATVVILLLVIIIPGTLMIGIVATQAFEVSESVGPWVQRHLSNTDRLDEWLAQLPMVDQLAPYRDQITQKLAELTGTIGKFTVNALAATTKGTASFFFSMFIMLYGTFYFLKSGQSVLDRALYYVPLPSADEDRLVGRFLSVARATIKGTLVIALVQGALGAAGLALLNVQGAVFWGAMVAVLSLIPAVGASIIWVPVAIYLLAVGRVGAAVFLVVWFNVVVGTTDNFLRPVLVGKDTQMSDLMVVVSTLGGLATFGISGLIVGPIVAALFDTVWTIYGETFKSLLPPRAAKT